ncbi:periplasmic protein of mal regulon [Xenorhabdus bovienii str. kraussei Quebec]|uniref:Periplasmic protein of mal regulon n=2 Tax=Xenorhabdus bovienii TaxID=40576 RepID=A0A077PG19_XENBV|nr:periplasmic protein of mal regulon [Xenorhabdus bovienii str. kraussei Quebec]
MDSDKANTMKIKLLSVCLSTLLCYALPAASYAAPDTAMPDSSDNVVVPDSKLHNTTAPALTMSSLQKLKWLPANTHATQAIILNSASSQINEGDIQGAVAAFALPANQGALEITLNSLIKDKQVYSPNVLVLDEQLRPAAFYPSHYFQYQRPGIMSVDRLEGTLKLTPALGQQQIYLLVYTTRADLQSSTQMVDPAKAYAQGVGNAVPNIPDPMARHTETGTLTLKVKSERDAGNVLIGQAFSAPAPKPVTVGSMQTATTAVTALQPVVPAIAPKNKPVLGDTEKYFNDAIKKAINSGDIDKALHLLDEAERLGSATARDTFIKMIKNLK